MMIKKFGALLLSAVLCIGMAAPAFAYGDDTAPVEQPILPEVVEEDVVTITDETSGALTPEGNLTLVDDYHTNYSDGSGQQFITLVSKSGATFYLVIDRNAKGQQTVHFMNLVDEADLLALMEEDQPLLNLTMYGGKRRLEIRWVRCPARPGLRPRPAHRSEYRNRPCPRCNLHQGQGLLSQLFSSASAGDRNRSRRPQLVQSGQLRPEMRLRTS